MTREYMRLCAESYIEHMPKDKTAKINYLVNILDDYYWQGVVDAKYEIRQALGVKKND